ncbi:MAG: CvpA family protein [Lentisphaeria bacterium]|nr:CvpA family protein [Lentisphaeria bacterium]
MILAFDLIFLFILTLYFVIGWNKGLVYAIIDVVGVLAAYILTAFFSKSLAIPLASSLGILKIQAWFISALLIFFSIIITVNLFKKIISNGLKRKRENIEEFHLSMASKLSGALISTILGLIVLSIILTSYEVISGLSGSNNFNLSKSKSSTVASCIFSNITSSAVKKGQSQDIIQSLIKKPRVTTKRVKGVFENVAFRKVFTSKSVINQTLAGDRFELANNELLLAALANEDLKLRLESLKVIEPQLTATAYRDLVLDQLVELGARLKASGNDKRLKFEINELNKSGDLKKGNMSFLYKNKNFQNILDILFF